MEYSNKRKQINTSRSIGIENASVNVNAQDSAYQAYLQAVLAGRAKADSETMGHRQDLAPSLAAKMSKAFGMDLSQMKLYRSGAMEGTETKGMASGNNIVLSKDIDLNTMEGQAVLGHEISHVRAQSQGIGMGHSGLYQNAGLEHQADVEGMMAARGQSILGESTGMDMGLGTGSIGGLTALGPGMSVSAGAPMQAKKPKKNKKSNAKTQKKAAAPKNKKTEKNFKDYIKSVTSLNDGNDQTYEEWKPIATRENYNDKFKNGMTKKSFEDWERENYEADIFGPTYAQYLAKQQRKYSNDKYGKLAEKYGKDGKMSDSEFACWSRMGPEINYICRDMSDEELDYIYNSIEGTKYSDQKQLVVQKRDESEKAKKNMRQLEFQKNKCVDPTEKQTIETKYQEALEQSQKLEKEYSNLQQDLYKLMSKDSKEAKNKLKIELYKHYKSNEKNYAGLLGQMNYEDMAQNAGSKMGRDMQLGAQMYDTLICENKTERMKPLVADEFDGEQEADFQKLFNWHFDMQKANTYYDNESENRIKREKYGNNNEDSFDQESYDSMVRFLKTSRELDQSSAMSPKQLAAYKKYLKGKNYMENVV